MGCKGSLFQGKSKTKPPKPALTVCQPRDNGIFFVLKTKHKIKPMPKGNIRVQTENIFPIIKKFLYSDHDIFIRELVSNAVDATQKLNEVMSIAQARLDVQKSYIPKFRAAMSSIMVTRFFQIDNKLRAMVQCDVAKMVPLAQPSQPEATKSSETF